MWQIRKSFTGKAKETIIKVTKSIFFGLTSGTFSFATPLTFTFDHSGNLYSLRNQALFTFDLNSNQQSTFANVTLNSSFLESGITYDFDNDRILITSGDSTSQELIAIDINSQEVTTLFSFIPPTNCNAKALEYVGNNTLIVSGGNFFNSTNNCGIVYTIDIETQQVNPILDLGNSQGYADFLFVEDEIENVTLNTTTFNCNNLGVNTIEVIQNIDGTPVTCEVQVTVTSTFEFENCPIYRQLNIDTATGMGIIPNIAQSLNLISSCSTDFTITQDIPPGTLVNAGENMVVIITATDELGQTAQCFVTVSTNPLLSTDDISLDLNIITYPNPTQDRVTISNMPSGSSGVVQIFNISGQEVMKTDFRNAASDITVDLSQLRNGIYFMQLSIGGQNSVQRIIKQ